MRPLKTMLVGAAAVAMAAAAQAQVAQVPITTMTLEGRNLAVSAPELRALSDLNRARTMDRASQDRAIARAEQVANGADARYVLALYRLDIGQRRRDDALVARALDGLIGHAGTPPGKLASYLAMRGAIAFRRNDAAAAAADWARAAEMQPGDRQALMNLAQARSALGDVAGATDLIRRAIAAAPAGAAPEAWHRQWLSIAFNGRAEGPTVAAAQALVVAYPTASNWHLALDLYRQVAAPGGEAEIALLQLIRTASGLIQAAEYQRLAQLLLQAGDRAEAQAVLEEGVRRGVVRADEPPTPDILRAIARAPSPATPHPAPRDPAAQAWREAAVALGQQDRARGRTLLRAIADAVPPPRWYADMARFWLIRLDQPRSGLAH